jgi:serine/threonine-protein kinase
VTLPAALAERYTVLGPLGAGASGDVLEAQDRALGRLVAIKLVPRPGPGAGRDATDAYARFVREAQAAGRLTHPNIITVHEFGESASAAWIVMEKAAGGSLKTRLEQGGRLPPAQAVALTLQVLDALARSHAAGIVHRDIKPGNILLSEAGDVRIVDFGIARIEDSTLTRQGEVTGTPSYMAPEQVGGEVADARTDLWATGAVLYEALTGTKAFDGAWPVITHRIRNTEPAPASALAVDLPPALDAVLAKAMAKRPAERFQTATAFAEALRAAMAPAPARRPRRWPLVALALLGVGAAAFLTRAPEPPEPLSPEALACVLPGAGLGAAAAVAPTQCPLLDLLRRLDAPMLEASLADGARLAEGALLRFDATLPDWARFLAFDYVQADGTVVHLDQLGPRPGGTRFRLGEPGGDFPGWTIAPPFGTDLLLLVATERAILPTTWPESEPLAALLAALEAARGERMAFRLLRIETTPR